MVTPEEMYGKEEEIISLLGESGAKLSNTCKTSVEIRERQTRVGMLRREEELGSPQETREVLVTTRRRILVEDRCGENDCRGCKLKKKSSRCGICNACRHPEKKLGCLKQICKNDPLYPYTLSDVEVSEYLKEQLATSHPCRNQPVPEQPATSHPCRNQLVPEQPATSHPCRNQPVPDPDVLARALEELEADVS